MKRMLMLCAVLSVPGYVYGVDGQILINQSTVNAAGGFPYIITQPGSYKLSGNLTMNTTPNGNINGLDVAIVINSSNVTFDLNGFTIFVTDQIGVGHRFIGIDAGVGILAQISIVNGSITLTSTSASAILASGVFFPFSSTYMLRLEELNIAFRGPDVGFGTLVETGPDSLVRHVVTDGLIEVACPSTIVENVGVLTLVPYTGVGCTIVNLGMFPLVVP